MLYVLSLRINRSSLQLRYHPDIHLVGLKKPLENFRPNCRQYESTKFHSEVRKIKMPPYQRCFLCV